MNEKRWVQFIFLYSQEFNFLLNYSFHVEFQMTGKFQKEVIKFNSNTKKNYPSLIAVFLQVIIKCFQTNAFQDVSNL